MAYRTLYEILDHEIAHGTQRSVAVLYAMTMTTFVDNKDACRRFNNAIQDRWSFGGLERVKKMAWSIHDGMTKDEPE